MWRLDTDLEMSSKAFVIAHFARFSVHVFSHYFESHRKSHSKQIFLSFHWSRAHHVTCK